MQSSTGPSSVQSRRGLLRLSVGIGLAGLVIAACGSEPPLPAAEYFPTVEAELARLDQATKDLTDRFATELENEVVALVEANPEADQVELFEQAIPIARSKMQSIISSHVTQLAVFAERVEPLIPPDVIRSAHRELVAAMSGWAATGDTTVALLDAAADRESLVAAISASPYADAQARVRQACDSLQPNAASVGVVLTCPGEQLSVLQVAP